jgi:two-component system, LytTR family, response regulator
VKIKLNAIIIDDSQESTDTLVKVLEKYFKKDVFVSNTYTNASDALAEMEYVRPEIIFLDLEMPEIDGFETYKLLPEELNPYVIIYSGKSEAGIKVINNLEVEGFVTKPIVIADIRTSIEKIKKKIKDKFKIPEKNDSNELIVLNSQTRTLFIDSERIHRIEALGSYTNVYYDNTFINTTKNLKYFETFLNPSVFVRVDRSFIININNVQEIVKSNFFSELIMKDDFRLKFSNDKMNELIKKISKNTK